MLSLYAEAYDNRSARTRAREGALMVTITIYSAQGAGVHRTMDEVQSPPPASGASTSSMVRSTLPLAQLEPGAYVLEVALARYGEPVPTVTRSVPFQVR